MSDAVDEMGRVASRQLRAAQDIAYLLRILPVHREAESVVEYSSFSFQQIFAVLGQTAAGGVEMALRESHRRDTWG